MDLMCNYIKVKFEIEKVYEFDYKFGWLDGC